MKALLEQDVCEGASSPLIGGELADQLRAERFDTPPLFFGVYDLVEVEDSASAWHHFSQGLGQVNWVVVGKSRGGTRAAKATFRQGSIR